MKWTAGLALCLLVLPSLAPASSAFSDESLKDLSRLPHLQRHWLQRLEQVSSARRNKVTTSPPSSSSAAATTDAVPPAEESLEVVEDAERVTTTAPIRRDAADAAESGGGVVTLTISEAKEKLKARRMKSRKKTQMEQQQSYQQYNKRTDDSQSTGEDTFEVKKHIQRMSNATCSSPAARLVYVGQQHEAAANVRYLPTCTWLHRCSDEIGCCADDSKTCSASHIETVSLPFFVLTMTSTETKRTVTRLTFENHTACECVGRNSDLMPRTEPHQDESSQADDGRENGKGGYHENKKKKMVEDDRRHHHHHRHRQQSGTSSSDEKKDGADLVVATAYSTDRFHPAGSSQRTTRPQPKSINSKCRCPSGYASSKKRPCICQCQRNHRQCDRLERGLELFSPRDRGCLIEKRCQTPSCHYGRYVILVGRCPRRDEKTQPWLRLVS